MACLTSLAVLLPPATAGADVVRVIVDRRDEVLGGRPFGGAGAYEKLVGRIFFEFDPDSPANAGIVDLRLAPRNGAGRVEAWADLVVLQPRDPSRRSGVAWLEVGQRGGQAALRYLQRGSGGVSDPTAPEDFGDGLLMHRGMTLIWIGWQWDLPDGDGLLRLHVPSARMQGEALRGPVRVDWTIEGAADRLHLGRGDHRPYLPVDPEAGEHVLTVREGPLSERRTVDRDRWRFVTGSGVESDRFTWIELDGGFEAGNLYELVYTAEHPRIAGLGLAAVRDAMAYAKYGLRSEFPALRGIAFGVSQGGRFLRQFLYEGFNSDERGRKVFDGMLIHGAGAGRAGFNHRFAQPSRAARPGASFFHPIDLFPFTSLALVDPATGREDGLERRTPEAQRPLVFHVNTGYEYWGRAASLTHTLPDGGRDALASARERIYHVAGAQQVPGSTPGPGAESPEDGGDEGSPVDYLLVLRALAVRLVEWVVDGTDPPPSAHPLVSAGTLVSPRALAFPRIPGAVPPGGAYLVHRADFGPDFQDRGVVDLEPPRLGAPFASLVPQVDGLGNELGGVRPFELRVPLATYAPWHLRADTARGEGWLLHRTGAVLPLPATEEDRVRTGDPRPSIQVLYDDKPAYMRRVVAALQALANAGLLLAEDAGAAAEQADRLWDWATGRRPGTGGGLSAARRRF